MAAAFVQSVGICHCAAVRNMTSLTSFCQSCRCSDCVSKQSALLCCLHLFAWSSHIITILLPSLSSSITVISYQLSFAAFGFGLRSVCGACMKARWVDMKTWLKKPLICGNYSYSCFLDYPTLKGIIMLIKQKCCIMWIYYTVYSWSVMFLFQMSTKVFAVACFDPRCFIAPLQRIWYQHKREIIRNRLHFLFYPSVHRCPLLLSTHNLSQKLGTFPYVMIHWCLEMQATSSDPVCWSPIL